MRAAILFLITAAVFIVAQGTGHPVLFHLFYVLAGTLVTSYVWAWLNLRGLTAERELMSMRAQVGKPLEEHILVRNESIWPKLWVEVHDMTDLPAHQARFVTSVSHRGMRHTRVRTQCELRGKYSFGPILIRTSDPLGLFHFQKRLPSMADVLVYPATDSIHDFPLPPAELPGGTATRRRTHHTTPNVAGAREYAPGDSFNRIHWPSSARQQRLIVKEFELDPTADLWIVMDMQHRVQQSTTYRGRPTAEGEHTEEVRTPESTEEYVVTAAASLANYFVLTQRRNTGLIAYGQYREIIMPEREPRQFYHILESLAVLRAWGHTPLQQVLAAEANRFSRQTSLIIITPSTDDTWVKTGLRDLLYSGIYATIVLVDGATFGGVYELSRVKAELTAHNVPFYALVKDQPIGASLSGPAGALSTLAPLAWADIAPGD
jgi:uncharacterized protein (DUF58 family)